MNNLVYNGYTGSINVSIEDDCLHGKILFINDIISYEGNTVSEIKTSFENAVDRYLEYCQETGKQANKPYSGTFNVRIEQDLHRKAAEAAFRQNISLNEFVENSIKTTLYNNDVIKVEHTHHHNHEIKILEYAGSMVAVAATEEPRKWGNLCVVK